MVIFRRVFLVLILCLRVTFNIKICCKRWTNRLTASMSRASSNSFSRRCWNCCSFAMRFLRITAFSWRAWSNWTATRRSCCDCRISLFTIISSRRASWKKRSKRNEQCKSFLHQPPLPSIKLRNWQITLRCALWKWTELPKSNTWERK